MVHDRETAGQLLPIIGRADFANEALGAVYAAVQHLFNQDAPIDRLTVVQELGSDAYTALIQAALDIRVVPGNAEYYAGMLRERSRLDRIRDAATTIAYSDNLDAARQLVDTMNAELVTRRQWEAVTMDQALNRFCDRHADTRTPDFLDFGFPKLKQRLYLERGDFIVIAGEPSTGKTALASQMAMTLAKKHRVGFFTLETSSEKLTDRMMAQLTKIPLKQIKANLLKEDEWRKVAEAAQANSTLTLEQIPAAGMTVQDIQSYSIAHHYSVIFVDYLQIVAPSNRRAQRYEQVTQISMELHTLAQQAGIAVIALAQLSRPDKSKKKREPPGMHDLRDSGQIEQDADAVLLLYLKDPSNAIGPRMLKIGKNKEGERADFEVNFDGNTQTFTEAITNTTWADIRKAAKQAKQSTQVKMEEIGEEDGDLPF